MELPPAQRTSPTGWSTAPDASASSWATPAQPPGCQICGSVPATDVTLVQVIGMVIVRKTKTVRARACRDCGPRCSAGRRA